MTEVDTPGALHAFSHRGAIQVQPEPGRIVRFGRGGDEDGFRVDLPVGTYDLGVSRLHGELTYEQGHWWLRNTGKRLIRLPNNRQLPDRLECTDEPIALNVGFTQVSVMGTADREHAIELYVFGDLPRASPPPDACTVTPRIWELTGDERLVLVVMGQRYLLNEPDASPLTYRETAVELEELAVAPGKSLRSLRKKVERTVEKVRKRFEETGEFPYPLRQDPDGPYDDTLKRNLLRGLVESTTLGKADLDRLDRAP
jgi:hypothetical protein